MDCKVYRRKAQRDSFPNNNQSNVDDEWEEFDELFMETIDSNEVQHFFVESDPHQSSNESCDAIRIEFGKSADFYGRIVIYSLEVWGYEC